MIHGERIRAAREMRGQTQTALADAVGVTQGAIAQIESDLRPLSPDLLSAIAVTTGFPIAFFQRPPRRDFPLGSLLFRQHKAASARDQKRAHRYGELVDELADRMGQRLNTLRVLLPRLHLPDITIDEAASIVRSALGIAPDIPIDNLTRAAERAGVLVFTIPVNLEHHQAFSLWTGSRRDRPVIGCVRGQPPDRWRFTIAHELGHLALHDPPQGDVEGEANRFAAELLVPAEAFLQEVSPPITLSDLVPLKRRWRVAIQMLVRRCRDLGVVTERQYRYLFQQIGARGWRRREPVDIPAEQPRTLSKMAEVLYGTPIDYRRMAADHDLPFFLAREIVESHSMIDRPAGSVIDLRPPTGSATR